MIIVILCKTEENGREVIVVSHGYDYYTDKVVILPCEIPEYLGAKFSLKFNEWILEDYPGEELDIFNKISKEDRLDKKEFYNYENPTRVRLK